MTGARLTLSDLRGSAARRRRETLVRGIFVSAAVLSIVISLLIVVSLAGPAWEFISRVDLSLLVSDGWLPRRGRYDLATLFAGTLSVAGVAMLIATPLGLGAAVYLSEYATPRMRRALKPILEILAGIPSVVLGFYALAVLAPTVIQPLCNSNSIFSIRSEERRVGKEGKSRW